MQPSEIYINSLSYPLFISRALNIGRQTTLFWQEAMGQEVPGNMKNELEKAVTLKRIFLRTKSSSHK
nr:CAZy families GT8 protein [uncultured bacterium]